MIQMLADRLKVARRFTRAVRVDTDLQAADALDGYICAQSAVEALLLMARHHSASGHGAFTWTGPYGSGKSSLAVALAALAGGPKPQADQVLEHIGDADRHELQAAFRKPGAPWRIVPVVGRREDPAQTLADALNAAVAGVEALARWPDEPVHQWALRIAADKGRAGLLLMVDEMGKFLEGAARGDGDVHLFQELAETASRSQGRLIVVGILHQAFDEYAHRLAREARDEWMKVQGRFLDIPINLAGEEQLHLVGRAIEGVKPAASSAIRLVAASLSRARMGDPETMQIRLAACWPLHPVVAALLGPISRRRFGQNQRSLFGFLNSAEPSGFQAFLKETADSDAAEFPVARLWDYLHANLEPAILASPDGHRWSTALEAVERAEAREATADHFALLKTVALIDLFKDRSGLQASSELLASVISAPENLEGLLADLRRWSVVVYRSHVGAYAIYAGSDFDIEAAIDEAHRIGTAVDYRRLAQRAALQPILAKRHYEATGALRWFEVELTPLHEVEERVQAYKPAPGAAGLFLLAVSANAEPVSAARKILTRAAKRAGGNLVVCGWTWDSYMIREMASDLTALEHVRAHRPELEGDAIARREVDARLARLSADLEDRLSGAINRVDWYLPGEAKDVVDIQVAGPTGLSVVASRLSDWRYPQAPRLPNELVNRTRPSSNAQAAVRALLRNMVEKADLPRLGFTGYPPEAGLYASLLERTGLHDQTLLGGWRIAEPRLNDPANLAPLWAATDEIVERADGGVRASEIYAAWRAPPFGLRDGLLPILLTAYLLSRHDRSAVYLDRAFRPTVDRFLVDRLLQEPDAVQVRAVALTDVDMDFISAMAQALGTPDAKVPPTALEVARAIVIGVRAMPPWTLKTQSLSAAALHLRDRGKGSDDPNELLLKDLPVVLGRKPGDLAGVTLARQVLSVMTELRNAYSSMLAELHHGLLRELRVDPGDEKSMGRLRRRAEAILTLTGNFRLDALATRLINSTGREEDIEGLVSLAANRPTRDWVDRDVSAARVELAALAQQFLKAELLARVHGQEAGRTAMAVYISDPSFPEPHTEEIELSAEDRRVALALARKLKEILEREGVSREVAMAAIASLGLSLGAASAERRLKVAV